MNGNDSLIRGLKTQRISDGHMGNDSAVVKKSHAPPLPPGIHDQPSEKCCTRRISREARGSLKDSNSLDGGASFNLGNLGNNRAQCKQSEIKNRGPFRGAPRLKPSPPSL